MSFIFIFFNEKVTTLFSCHVYRELCVCLSLCVRVRMTPAPDSAPNFQTFIRRLEWNWHIHKCKMLSKHEWNPFFLNCKDKMSACTACTENLEVHALSPLRPHAELLEVGVVRPVCTIPHPLPMSYICQSIAMFCEQIQKEHMITRRMFAYSIDMP